MIKSYKSFDKNLKCRNFQYEIGKEYETEKAKVCECGFHACEYPLDVFNYYNPVDNRFCEVEQDGDISKHDDDSKVASSKIKIGAEIGIKGLIDASVKFIFEKVNWKDDNATNTGDYSAATVDGKDSVAISTGYKSKAKACLGSAIVICERGEWNGETYPLIHIKSAIIDGNKLKANTFYMLVDNEFVECE